MFCMEYERNRKAFRKRKLSTVFVHGVFLSFRTPCRQVPCLFGRKMMLVYQGVMEWLDRRLSLQHKKYSN